VVTTGKNQIGHEGLFGLSLLARSFLDLSRFHNSLHVFSEKGKSLRNFFLTFRACRAIWGISGSKNLRLKLPGVFIERRLTSHQMLTTRGMI
jgi:hypothetical protein